MEDSDEMGDETDSMSQSKVFKGSVQLENGAIYFGEWRGDKSNKTNAIIINLIVEVFLFIYILIYI